LRRPTELARKAVLRATRRRRRPRGRSAKIYNTPFHRLTLPLRTWSEKSAACQTTVTESLVLYVPRPRAETPLAWRKSHPPFRSKVPLYEYKELHDEGCARSTPKPKRVGQNGFMMQPNRQKHPQALVSTARFPFCWTVSSSPRTHASQHSAFVHTPSHKLPLDYSCKSQLCRSSPGAGIITPGATAKQTMAHLDGGKSPKAADRSDDDTARAALFLGFNFLSTVALININTYVFKRANFGFPAALSNVHYVTSWGCLALLKRLSPALVPTLDGRPLHTDRDFLAMCVLVGSVTPLNNMVTRGVPALHCVSA